MTNNDDDLDTTQNSHFLFRDPKAGMTLPGTDCKRKHEIQTDCYH